MKDDKLLKIGVIGTVIAALCCFTPILVVLVGIVGLSAIIGYLDFVLFPALGVFILITVYALIRRKRREQAG
ncbi:MAG: mercury resistance system transport protein MerF [Rhodobacteraceae bacterium]|nr:mercury resistance system transport protein MerF [Paracoccaceae bacterium]